MRDSKISYKYFVRNHRPVLLLAVDKDYQPPQYIPRQVQSHPLMTGVCASLPSSSVAPSDATPILLQGHLFPLSCLSTPLFEILLLTLSTVTYPRLTVSEFIPTSSDRLQGKLNCYNRRLN